MKGESYMDNYQYEPIIISGPSGAGKTQIIMSLRSIHQEISEGIGYTTRKQRPNEINGEEYYFVTKETFQKMISRQEFIEYTMYLHEYYGMPISELKKSQKQLKIFNVGLSSAMAIKEKFPHAITIYILPPNEEELLRRLGSREKERYEIAKREVTKASEFYEYLLISHTNDVKRSMQELEDIIYRNSNENRMEKYKSFLLHYYNKENPL